MTSYQQAKLALDHQRFLFTPDFVILAWKTLKTDAHIYYNLTSSCTSNSNSKVLINRMENESISLPPEELLDEGNATVHLNLTSFDVENGTFLTIERFRLEPGSEFNNCFVDCYCHNFFYSYHKGYSCLFD